MLVSEFFAGSVLGTWARVVHSRSTLCLRYERLNRLFKCDNERRSDDTDARSGNGRERSTSDASEVDSLPASLMESFCGVGNPFSLGHPQPHQVVLDLGCGAGFDTLLAARRVGANGNVIGVDMMPEMIAKARHAASSLGISNVVFIRGNIEALPLASSSVDLVFSHGVFNLCPDRPRVLSEVFRVLTPGGRLQMADILLEPHVTSEEVASKGSWSD